MRYRTKPPESSVYSIYMSNMSQFRRATVQGLRSHKWLVATLLDSAGLERVRACEVRLTLGTWWASQSPECTNG